MEFSLVERGANFGQLGPNSMLHCPYDNDDIFVGFFSRRGARLIKRSSCLNEQNYILNLFFTRVQIVKVGQICNVGSQAQNDVSLTANHGYKLERHDVHFIINSSHTSLSHLIGSYKAKRLSLSSTCVKEKLKFSDYVKGFYAVLTSTDFGSTLSF